MGDNIYLNPLHVSMPNGDRRKDHPDDVEDVVYLSIDEVHVTPPSTPRPIRRQNTDIPIRSYEVRCPQPCPHHALHNIKPENSKPKRREKYKFMIAALFGMLTLGAVGAVGLYFSLQIQHEVWKQVYEYNINCSLYVL